MKKTLLYLSLCFILLTGCIASVVYAIFFYSAITQPSGLVYYLHPGITKKNVVSELTQQGVFSNSLLASCYIYFHPHSSLKKGEYFFPKGSTIASIWRQVTEGTGFYYRPFTIIPGWSFKQLRSELLKTETLNHKISLLGDQEVMSALGHPTLNAEGEFYPDTYYYTRGISDLVILKRAFDLMQLKLHEAWEKRKPNLPYQSEYQTLIVASLIEKEAFLNEERPLIAGVIVNRLKKDMLLQIDPTVIYGEGEHFSGTIHKKDLQEENIYNTYVHKGLPPTPIACPSFASIQAATNPTSHDYFYFVATANGNHQFSKTLNEHHQAVLNAIHLKNLKDSKTKTSYFNHTKIWNDLNALWKIHYN